MRFLLSFLNIWSFRAFDSIFHLVTWFLKLIKFDLSITNLLKHLFKNIVSIFDLNHVLFSSRVSSLYVFITDVGVIHTVNYRSIGNIIEKYFLFVKNSLNFKLVHKKLFITLFMLIHDIYSNWPWCKTCENKIHKDVLT